ncbi:hypothetical protein [Nitrosopumilus sp.]|uniref:hypothetical protein n=1 Tax=Nitrosopumilus sp. TaxID=2024843 RepID=UPI00292F8D5B|nr:hypothetical protein [Nitrosopumilus sp.]
MTCKNILKFTTLSSILAFSIIVIGISNSHAEEEEGDKNYNMVGDVKPVLTFTFRDGVETYEFPVFEMGENFVSNSGATFSVEGTVVNSPLLHKAMDDAYKYRLASGNGLEYQTKYFDVDVDFVKNDESIFMLDYSNCSIDNYQVETLDSNDYESYFKDVGFAIVDKIDFECSGVTFDNHVKPMSTSTSFVDYDESGFNFANSMRTSVTFSFDGGMEKMEFPLFYLESGYEESTQIVTAEFKVEGILDYYPRLYEAIDNARQVSGTSHNQNTDFEVLVEFTNGETVLRGFDFRDCRVSEFEIVTKTDKEEGFTGKSGFAVAHDIGFACSGFEPINMYYDGLTDGMAIWEQSHITNMYEEPIKNSDKDIRAVAVFSYPKGTETVEFSMFTQSDMLSATTDGGDAFNRKTTYPTFEIRGIVGDYPMLYKFTDNNRQIHMVTGPQNRDLVDVDINLMHGDKVIRSFDYSDCRTVDYEVSTSPNSEESYVKDQFALENIFEFECQGYSPHNPMYDVMTNSNQKADTTSTMDLASTDKWAPGFYRE